MAIHYSIGKPITIQRVVAAGYAHTDVAAADAPPTRNQSAGSIVFLEDLMNYVASLPLGAI